MGRGPHGGSSPNVPRSRRCLSKLPNCAARDVAYTVSLEGWRRRPGGAHHQAFLPASLPAFGSGLGGFGSAVGPGLRGYLPKRLAAALAVALSWAWSFLSV